MIWAIFASDEKARAPASNSTRGRSARRRNRRDAKIAVMISLHINGEKVELAQEMTVAALLEARGLAGKRVAVERNGEIVPRSQHPAVIVEAGDRIEIVVAVGGG
jgi:sulfur carrier protein